MVEPKFLIDGPHLRPIASIRSIGIKWRESQGDANPPDLDVVTIEFAAGSPMRLEGDEAIRFINWCCTRTVWFDGTHYAATDLQPINRRKRSNDDSVVDFSEDRSIRSGSDPFDGVRF